MSRFRLVLSLAAITVTVPAGAQTVQSSGGSVLTISGGSSVTLSTGSGTGTMTATINAPVTATVAATDSVRIINVSPKDGADLAAVLKTQAAAAHTAGRTPFVELGATWCGPCHHLADALGDSLMKDAFAGTYVIHVDIDEWKGKLEPLGFKGDGIPAFFPIDDNGKALGPMINGGAWGEDIPQNMAPPLKKFFRANLKPTKKS